jgi:hypothetical protein
MSKYPVNGLTLSTQIKWQNKPEIVFLYVGGECLVPSLTKEIFYIALDYSQIPERLIWPVAGIHVLIVWGYGPGADIIKRVYDCVKASGAESVNVTVSEYETGSKHFAISEDFEEKKLQAWRISYEMFN